MLIHRLSQQLSHIVGCRVPSPCQSTEHSTTCCSARTLIRSYPDSAGFRSKGKAHSTAPTQRLYRGTHKIHLKKLLLTNNLKAQTRQRVSSTIILWMLDVEYLPPVRATNSRLENAKKSPITSRVFLCLSFGCSSVFSPSFEGFFFQFFCFFQYYLSRWPTARYVTGIFITQYFSVN